MMAMMTMMTMITMTAMMMLMTSKDDDDSPPYPACSVGFSPDHACFTRVEDGWMAAMDGWMPAWMCMDAW